MPSLSTNRRRRSGRPHELLIARRAHAALGSCGNRSGPAGLLACWFHIGCAASARAPSYGSIARGASPMRSLAVPATCWCSAAPCARQESNARVRQRCATIWPPLLPASPPARSRRSRMRHVDLLSAWAQGRTRAGTVAWVRVCASPRLADRPMRQTAPSTVGACRRLPARAPQRRSIARARRTAVRAFVFQRPLEPRASWHR